MLIEGDDDEDDNDDDNDCKSVGGWGCKWGFVCHVFRPLAK